MKYRRKEKEVVEAERWNSKNNRDKAPRWLYAKPQGGMLSKKAWLVERENGDMETYSDTYFHYWFEEIPPLPLTLTTEEEYEAAMKRLDTLMDARANTPEGQELDRLSAAIEKYEDKREPQRHSLCWRRDGVVNEDGNREVYDVWKWSIPYLAPPDWAAGVLSTTGNFYFGQFLVRDQYRRIADYSPGEFSDRFIMCNSAEGK